MSTEKFASEQMSVTQKEVHFTAAGQIPVRCGRVRLTANPTTGAYEVRLPPVAQAQGRFYSIICRNADAVNAINLTHDDDSECWAGDITFNGKCDKALAYSDGQAWLIAGAVATFTGTTEPPTSAPTTAAPQV